MSEGAFKHIVGCCQMLIQEAEQARGHRARLLEAIRMATEGREASALSLGDQLLLAVAQKVESES